MTINMTIDKTIDRTIDKTIDMTIDRKIDIETHNIIITDIDLFKFYNFMNFKLFFVY